MLLVYHTDSCVSVSGLAFHCRCFDINTVLLLYFNLVSDTAAPIHSTAFIVRSLATSTLISLPGFLQARGIFTFESLVDFALSSSIHHANGWGRVCFPNPRLLCFPFYNFCLPPHLLVFLPTPSVVRAECRLAWLRAINKPRTTLSRQPREQAAEKRGKQAIHALVFPAPNKPMKTLPHLLKQVSEKRGTPTFKVLVFWAPTKQRATLSCLPRKKVHKKRQTQAITLLKLRDPVKAPPVLHPEEALIRGSDETPANAQRIALANPTSPSYESPVISINDLKPAQSAPWAVVARVFARNQVRAWKNFQDGGTLLGIYVADSPELYIRATLFNQAVEKFSAITVPGVTSSVAVSDARSLPPELASRYRLERSARSVFHPRH